MKKTAWYPESVKPVRPGWYEIKFTYWTERCYWTGKSWTWAVGSSRLHNQARKWRGLTEKAA